jgi:biopolymer transport protein ExbD
MKDPSRGKASSFLGMASYMKIIVLAILLVLEWIVIFPPPTRRYKFGVRVLNKLGYDLAQAPPSELLVVVSIDKQKQVRLNLKEANLANLEEELRVLFEKLPSDRRVVVLKASVKLPYEEIVALLDAIKGAGAAETFLQIDYLD